MARHVTPITFAEALDAPVVKAVLDAEATGGGPYYGRQAFVRVYTYPPEMELQVSSTWGNLSWQGRRTETIKEQLGLTGDAPATSLSAPAEAILYYEWVGRALGALTLSGRDRVACDRAGCGVVRVAYQATYDVYAVSVPPSSEDQVDVILCIDGVDPLTEEAVRGDCHLRFTAAPGETVDEDEADDPVSGDRDWEDLVQGEYGDDDASPPDAWTDTEDASDEEPVVITVTDYWTEEPISGVQVSVDGVARGRSGTDGRVSIGRLAKGEHIARAIHSDYYDPDLDELFNSLFKI